MLSSFTGVSKFGRRVVLGLPNPILTLDAIDYTGSGSTWPADVGSNGTLENTPAYTSASPTYFSFDGVNETATTPDLTALFPTESQTIEIWAKTSSDNGVLVAKQGDGGGYHLAEMEIVSGDLKVGMWAGSGIASATVGSVTRNAWQHYVLTYNSVTGNLTGYINATTSASTSVLAYGPGSDRKLVLCAADITAMGDGSALAADIGFFRVWNKALTATQVLEVYNENVARFSIVTSGLTMQLDANNPASYPGTGSTWYDLTGNSDQTLVGSPTYVSGSPSYFTFDGFTQYSTGSTPYVCPPNTYTKMVWFQITPGFDNNLVSSNAGGHYMFFGSTSTLYAGNSNVGPPYIPGFGSATSFNADTWYCATVVFSSPQIYLYINGVQNDFDPTYSAGGHGGDGSVNLACFAPGGNLLNGKIAEVYCYGNALTAQQVLRNYNATKGKYGL